MGYQGNMRYRQLCFWGVFATLLTAMAIAGLEVMSAFVVPPWPERELRRRVVARTERQPRLWRIRRYALSPLQQLGRWGLRALAAKNRQGSSSAPFS